MTGIQRSGDSKSLLLLLNSCTVVNRSCTNTNKKKIEEKVLLPMAEFNSSPTFDTYTKGGAQMEAVKLENVPRTLNKQV